MRLALDSSALAKRYVREPGTDDVVARCAGAEEIVLSVLCVPEVLSALNRLRREGRLGDTDYRRLKRDLAADVAQATIVDVSPSVVTLAIHCLESAPVHAADALHLASASASGCDLFLTADRRQLEGARVTGVEAALIG